MAEERITVPLPLPEIKPNPDPTERTIEQIRREVQGVLDIISTRLDGYDKAIGLLQGQVDREPKPPVLEASISHMREMLVSTEKTVDQRFLERDKRNEQMIRDSKALIDGAMTAMKEAFTEQNRSSQAAIGKSETSISKQMDQIESKFGTEIKALTTQLNDVKNDIVSMKSSKEGSKESKEDLKGLWGVAIGSVMMIIAVVTLIYTLNKPPPVVQVVPAQAATSGQAER